jgi:hypothetical protein
MDAAAELVAIPVNVGPDTGIAARVGIIGGADGIAFEGLGGTPADWTAVACEPVAVIAEGRNTGDVVRAIDGGCAATCRGEGRAVPISRRRESSWLVGWASGGADRAVFPGADDRLSCGNPATDEAVKVLVRAGGGAPAERDGKLTPLGGAFRVRRGGSGGRRRPHAWQTARSSAFSALQNGQNLI